MIVFEIWPKNKFFIKITKKRNFARNKDNFRDVAKKLFFHSNYKKRFFCPNYWQFFRCGQKTILLILITKKLSFARHIDIFRDVAKRRFFHRDHKNVILPEVLIVFGMWPKNDFFIVITKKKSFVRNIDSFRDVAKKRFFSYCSQKNDILPDMLIIFEIRPKTIFS